MKICHLFLCSLGGLLLSSSIAQAAESNPLARIKNEIVANDGASFESFGYAIALHGDMAVIGAPAATIGGNQAQGAVYVFQQIAGTWTQMQKLIANDGAAFDDFGNSVAFDGSTIIVGAPDAAINGNAAQGAAYIFTESAGSWTQTQKLVATDGAFGNEFGESVAIEGQTALIGAIQLLHGPGAAYVFNDSDGSWTQAQKLIAAEGSDTFGDAVALDGDEALIGAQQTSVGGLLDAGAAFVFANENGTWTETALLTAREKSIFGSFGGSVALQGSIALIGAAGTLVNGVQTGAAYIFQERDGTWREGQQLTAGDALAGDGFGSSVALSGSQALIGADQYATNGKGKAYLFQASGNSLTQVGEARAANGAGGDEFGWSVALDGRKVLLGAPNASVEGNEGAGAVYAAHTPSGD